MPRASKSPSMVPSVSVALCTYNGERFVRAQLESIAAQSRPVTEVVICDDGSTDGTVAVVRAFIAGYAGPTDFRLVDISRVGGVSANFARAIAACTGELIALSDQDDVWRDDRVEAAVSEFAARPQLLLLHSDGRVVDAQGSPTGETLLGALYVSPFDLAEIHAGRAFPVLIKRNLVTGAATMFRRRLLGNGLPLAEHWVHDEWLAILAAAQGGLDTVEQPLIDYRVHGGNQIGVASPTLSHRLSQLRAPRADRLASLAARSHELVSRLESLEAPGTVLALARRKAEFEKRRALYPRARFKRIGPVLANTKHRNYRDLSSQGSKDVLRDLVQPA